MGKAKKNKSKRTNIEPTGLPSVREFEAQMEASSAGSGNADQTNAILNIIEKLQSPSADERECTCLTITNLIGQPNTIPQFLHAGLTRVVAPLLIDASVGVRQASLGVLRNMTVDGGQDVCDKMVEQDVMTPLVTLLQKFGAEWTAEGKNKQDAEVFHQALHLMWNLCEASPTAVKIVNQQNLLPVFLPCVLPSNHGYPIAVTAAQCLYTITEDNTEVCASLSRPEAFEELQNLLTAPAHHTEQMLHKLLIAGIMYNLSAGDISSFGSAVLNQVIELLVAILQHDVNIQMRCIAQFIKTLDSEEPLRPVSNQDEDAMSTEASTKLSSNGDVDTSMVMESTTTGHVDDDDDDNKVDSLPENVLEIKHKKLDEMITETRTLITAQQLAVEMVANFCCSSDDDGWEVTDISDSGSDDMSSDTGDTSDTGDAVDAGDQDIDDKSLCLPSEIQKAFVASGLIIKVFQKLKAVHVDLSNLLTANSQTKIVYVSYEHLLVRCLLCTSNLVDAVDVEDLGGATSLNDLWTALSGLTQAAAAHQSLDLLEAATTALRAVVDKLDEVESPQLQQIKESDLQFLFDLGTQCKHCEVRANAIRMTCTIGSVLLQHDQLTMCKSVGEFLCHVVTSDNELWVVAEALDAMFDVFAEDKTDPIVKELGLVSMLRELVPVLKKKVQQQKKHLGEHYPIISTAKTNLVRFIKYKASRPTTL